VGSSPISSIQHRLLHNGPPALYPHLTLEEQQQLSIQAAIMSTDYKFQGWLGLDPSCVDGMVVFEEHEPKTWEETDIDLKSHPLRYLWHRYTHTA